MRFWLTIGFVFITIIVVVMIYHDEYSTTIDYIESKIGEINHLLSYADLEKHIEYCSSISLYLESQQYIAVAIRLEELKKILLEVKNNQSIKEKKEYDIQLMVLRLGSDITAVRDKWKNVVDFDSSKVLEHVNEVSTFLQEISTKLKYQTI